MRSWISLALTAALFSVAAEAAESPKEWTFLIYLNGNNNLDPYGAMDINEMEKVGSTDKVNVVVQWASLANGPTRRLLVKQDGDPETVTSPVVEDIGNVDMGDWRSLVEFVRWGAAHYPARHYFVNVWDHGSGWHLSTLGMMRPKDISWDDRTHNFIKTEQLAQALHEAAGIIGHKVDVYGSDACLMGMAEVADEMAGDVQTFVGSEEVEPLKGWPYDTLLARWIAAPAPTGGDIARILVEEYVKSYQGGSQGSEEVTLSAFDLEQLGEFNRAISGFGRHLRGLDSSARGKILDAAENTQKFTYGDYGDLLDFVDLAEKSGAGGLDRGVLRSVRDATARLVIANAATSSYAKANGIALWLPSSQYSFDRYVERYRGLKFHAHTAWGDAVQAFVK